MQVTSIGGATSTLSTTPSNPERQLDIGQDAFMKLLLTQLRYQDPLSPMDDRDFVTQLAQFSSLSEMQKLNQAFAELATVQSLASATAFIGKSVSGISESGESVAGVVQASLLREGKVFLRVQDKELPISTISEVALGGSGGQTG